MSQDLSVSYTPQFVSLVLTGNKNTCVHDEGVTKG